MSGLAATMVEVFIFCKAKEMARYLLLQRSSEDYLPSLWQGVTGRIERAETAINAALREVHEETGFNPKELWRVNHVSVFYAPRTDRIQCVPTFAVPMEDELVPKLSVEHEAWEWVGYEEAWERLPWSTSRKALEICHQEIANVNVPNHWLRLLPVPSVGKQVHEGPA